MIESEFTDSRSWKNAVSNLFVLLRQSMRNKWSILIALSLAVSAFGAAQSVSEYDIVWETPSEDSSGSMPIGNGDIGLNLWVNPAGELVFYVSKTDSWSENARLLKLAWLLDLERLGESSGLPVG